MRKRKKSRFLPTLHTGVIGCLAFLLVMAAGVESLAAKEAKVTTEMVNVRSEADQNSQRVGQLPEGTAFTVTEEATDGNGKVWYHAVYTSDGQQKSGWIRSDMAEITSEDEPQAPEEGSESPEETEGTISAGATVNGISILEPESLPEISEDFSVSQVSVGDSSYTALAVSTELTGGAEFYLVYGQDASGTAGWYYYDAQQGTIQRDAGQFTAGKSESEGLIEALRSENEDLQKSHEEALALRTYIMIGMGALCLILLIVVIVLAVKLSRVEYVDDEDYDEDDEDESDPSAEKSSWIEEAMDEAEDLAEAYLESEETEEMEEIEEPEEPVQPEQKPAAEESETETAAYKAVEAQGRIMSGSRTNISEDDYDDSEDFDIEIVDLDDLDL